MLDTAVLLAVIAAGLAVVFALLRSALMPRFHFLVQISDSRLHVTKGKVSAEFLDSAREICEEYKVTSGWIGGVKRGKSIALKFSRSFPSPCQQRLRNIWFCP